jgi:hypothetical protein
MRYAVLLIFLTLIGCASIDSEWKKFKGRNISVLVDKISYPTEKRDMLGKTIYLWKTGNPRGLYCDLEVVVDEKNTILEGNYNGNNGGCENLARRMQ